MLPDPSDPRLTFGRFLLDVAARHAGRRALHFEGRDVGYAELETETRQLARALIGVGVVKGARVAVLMANRPECSLMGRAPMSPGRFRRFPLS